jgi:hypothetical protein
LTCAAFDETVQVPTNWVAETPELRKKTNRLRGTAGPRRAAMIVAIAKDTAKPVSKLTFMDPPIGPEPRPHWQPGAANLVIPPPVLQLSSLSLQSSEEMQVCISFKMMYHLLTNSFSTGDGTVMPSLGSFFRTKRKAVFTAADECKATKAIMPHTVSQPEPASSVSTTIIVSGTFPDLHQ